MRAALLIGAALLAAFPASADTSADESLVSERLSQRAMGVLDGMLGPGRAKVLVEVRGERLQVRTETEFMTPLNAGSAAPPKGGISAGIQEALRMLDLPGYYKERTPSPAPEKPTDSAKPEVLQPFQKDFEHSLRDAGFEIKKIEATAVLDSALTETEARDAAQILPQLLRIDAERGDSLSIVRAPMRPAWKTAFSTPSDWRKLAFAASALIAALIMVLIMAGAFIGGARVFAKELTNVRREPLPAPSPIDTTAAEPLPELMPGASGLIDAGAGAAPGYAGGDSLQMGRRFDFLDAADAVSTARILSEEPAADVAQVFAYLAKIAPETASRLFAKLPSEVQAAASEEILRLKAVDPDRLSEIEDRLKVMIANGLQGSQRLATILSRFPGDDRAMLLGRLADKNSRGAEEIESQLFSFEDFESVSPVDLRRVMGAVPYELWGVALRGSAQSLVNRILSELPEGPRALVREETAKPQPKDKVVSARSKILDTFLALAEKGQVHLDRGGEETL